MKVVPDQERCEQAETEHNWLLKFNPEHDYGLPYAFWYCTKCRVIEQEQ